MKGFLMKDNKNIEQLLLDDISSEDLLNSKIEQEFTSQLEDKGCREKKFVTDLKLAPKEKLFSKDAVYLVINKNSKTKSYINGVQAEGFLGSHELFYRLKEAIPSVSVKDSRSFFFREPD